MCDGWGNSNKCHQGISDWNVIDVIREIAYCAWIKNTSPWRSWHYIFLLYCKKWESCEWLWRIWQPCGGRFCPLLWVSIKNPAFFWISEGRITSPSIRIAHSQFQRWHLKTVLLKCQMLFSYSKATKKPTSQRWKKKRVKTTFSLFRAKQIFLQFRLPNQAITQGMWKSVFGNCLDFGIFFSWSLKRQKVFLWSNFCLLCENSIQLSSSLSYTGDLASVVDQHL